MTTDNETWNWKWSEVQKHSCNYRLCHRCHERQLNENLWDYNFNYSSNLNNKVSKNSFRAILSHVLSQDPSCLRVDVLTEPLSAGLVYPVFSSRPHREKANTGLSLFVMAVVMLSWMAQRDLPGQAALEPTELQTIGEVPRLPGCRMAAALFPLLQLQHEEEAEAGPHHQPVIHARQVEVHIQCPPLADRICMLDESLVI